jgi:hypothetical protein
MLTVKQMIFPEERFKFFESILGNQACLSLSTQDGSFKDISCGTVHAVDPTGVALWHMGEARFVTWEEFNTVEVFSHG